MLRTGYQLEEALERLDQLSRLELDSLADRFAIERSRTLSDIELCEILHNKAKDYQVFIQEIETIIESKSGLDYWKAAIDNATSILDLHNLEVLLSAIGDAEPEVAAKMHLLQADSALLRNSVGDAFEMLLAATAASDSGGSIETARRRLEYEERLYAHGLRYGTKSLSYSERMIRTALDDLSETTTPDLWAGAQNNLGNALYAHGERLSGGARVRLIGEATSAYRASLRVWTEASQPLNWAMTQNNLGNALQTHGRHLKKEAGARLLGDAVAAYRCALRVWTEASYPLDWAATLSNLGAALRTQAAQVSGEERLAALSGSVAAYQAVLRVWTKAEYAADWAATQNELGNALQAQGRLGAGSRPLGDAVAAYRSALQVWTKAAHPVDWAMTMVNLGSALETIAHCPACGEENQALADAEACYLSALEIFDLQHTPCNYEVSSTGLARVRECRELL